MRRALPTLLLALAIAACVGIPRTLQTPEVSFVGLKTVDASMFEQKLTVRMKVRNPNPMELPVNGLDVDIELADEPFAQGVSAREFVVPANGEAEFDMNVTANAANALLMWIYPLPRMPRPDHVGIAIAPDAVVVFHDGDTFTVLPELSAPPTAPGAVRVPLENTTP